MSDNQFSNSVNETPVNETTMNDTNGTSAPDAPQAGASSSTDSSRVFTETWESLEMMGSQVLDYVKQLAQRGNVSRVIVSRQDGKRILDITLTAGVLTTGAITLVLPQLAGLGVLGLLIGRMKVEVVRVEGADAPPADEPAVDIAIES